MLSIKIALDGNPLSTQHIYRYFCRGGFAGFYMTKEGKEMKQKYWWEIKGQYNGKVLTEDCEVKIDLFFSSRRRFDIDNFNKLILDSLEGIVLEDDKQIQKLTITKSYSKGRPRIEIEICSLGNNL